MRSMQPEVDLLGETARRFVEEHDFLRENFWLLFTRIYLADHQDGFADRQQFPELIVVLIHAEDLHGALEVLHRDHRVWLAALLGDAVLDDRDHPADAGERPIL